VTAHDGGALSIGTDPAARRTWLELEQDTAVATVRLTEGELLMTVDALVIAYADLCGTRADSLARGVNRTLRNRTRAARESRQAADAGSSE
jgi:hypothetical protein